MPNSTNDGTPMSGLIVTPPDAVSMVALLIPMGLLYEVGIWGAQIFIKHTQAPDEGDGSASSDAPKAG